MLIKSSSSTALENEFNFIKVAIMRLFSLQTFNHRNVEKLRKDDVTSHSGSLQKNICP